MYQLNSIRDLEQFGIIPLTGEACSIGMRMLCDLTTQGKAIVEECFGVTCSQSNWNSGAGGAPHVASVLIPHDGWQSIGVVAVFRRNCDVAAVYHGSVVGYDNSELIWDGHPPIVYHKESAVAVRVYTEEETFRIEQPTPIDILCARYGSKEHSGNRYDPCFRTFRRSVAGQPTRGLSNVHAMSGRSMSDKAGE